MELAEVSRIVRSRKNDELMAAGVTIEDPATTYIDRDVDGRRRHDHSSGRVARRHDDDRRRLRNPQRRADRQFADRRSASSSTTTASSPTPRSATTRASDRSRTCGTDATIGDAREGRQLRRAEEDRARRRLEVDAPGVSRRRDDRRRTSTSAPARSPATTTARRSTRPIIEDGAFIGSDSQLIAPVTIGKGAYVGSGTTVREDVPPGALAVSAGKQRNIEGWVEQKQARKQETT